MGPGLSNPGMAALPANSLLLGYVLQTVGESSIASGNILNAASIAGSSRGAVNISTSQSVTDTSFATMATPDQVQNVVLPANDLIAVWYQATWQESVQGAARAAIFLGGGEAELATAGQGAPAVLGSGEAAIGTAGATGNNVVLASHPLGLASLQSQAYNAPYAGDVTTGQFVGGGWFEAAGTSYGFAGGPCYIFAAAGTYTVRVLFKASSGSVTASNRRLYVAVVPF